MTTLNSDRVAGALKRMYTAAEDQLEMLRQGGARFADLANSSPQERADALSDIYMPVTPEAGRLLYSLVRATKPAIIVEFGTSFGLSALHLAAAVRDNGAGHVFTTELSSTKIKAAKQTFTETGLDDVVTVLEGDALETLKTVKGEIGLVLLDGWKELYLPVLKVIEPQLATGALLIADNTSMADTQPYLDHVRAPANGYVSVNFLARDSDSMELSCRA